MEEKDLELIKYHKLTLAALEYNKNTLEFVSKSHFEKLYTVVNSSFEKGQLTKLKRFFRDIIDMQIHTKDLKFNTYLKDTTGYEIDVFETFHKRIKSIISRGKITTDNQYRDINDYLDTIVHTDPINKEKVSTLNSLLQAYETNKIKRK